MNTIQSSSKWLDYVSSLCWERGSLDTSSYASFLRAASLGIAPETALQEAAQRIQAAGDYPKASKLNRQLKRAYAYAKNQDTASLPVQPTAKPQYMPSALEQYAGLLGFDATPGWLMQVSPIVPWNKEPAYILQQLFRSQEKALVFSEYQSQGCQLWVHGDPSDSLNDLKEGCEHGAWFLSNPVNGEWHKLERLQSEHNPTGRSRRSEENLTSFRYAVLESDKAPKQLWLDAIAQMEMPIACITDSGGSSIHTLVRIDAADKDEWDSLVRGQLLPLVTALGADPQALTAVRLTRLPNCMRGSTLQQLLYLDPTPDTQDPVPICQKRSREPAKNAYLRWAESLIFWHGHKEIEGMDEHSARECMDGLLEFRSCPGVKVALEALRRLYVR